MTGDREGPVLPGLDFRGLGYVRGDLVAYAAAAEEQARQAWADGNVLLAQRAEGAASAYRAAADQIVAYSLEPTWSVIS